MQNATAIREEFIASQIYTFRVRVRLDDDWEELMQICSELFCKSYFNTRKRYKLSVEKKETNRVV